MSKQTIYNILAAKSEPVKVELNAVSELEQLYAKFDKESNDAYNIYQRLSRGFSDLGELVAEAQFARQDIYKNYSLAVTKARELAKSAESLGVEVPAIAKKVFDYGDIDDIAMKLDNLIKKAPK